MEYEQFKKVLVRIAALTATENQAGAINEKIEKAIVNKKKTSVKKSMVANDSMQKEDEILAKVELKKNGLNLISKDNLSS